jgi:carbon storage regulator
VSFLSDQGDAMLVLSRKVGEKILIGDNISVTVVRVAQGTVRLGVEAPTHLPIVREEIKDRPQAKPADAKLTSRP